MIPMIRDHFFNAGCWVGEIKAQDIQVTALYKVMQERAFIANGSAVDNSKLVGPGFTATSPHSKRSRSRFFSFNCGGSCFELPR